MIAAGVAYVYSFPGLAWLAGVAGIWALVELWRNRPIAGRRLGLGLVAALAVLVVLALPELDRIRDFADFRALHPDQANEGGLGNLPGQLSPLEALGIWPTSEFRLSAGASSLPAVVFYAGGLFALVALALALPRWIRRHGPAIPAALAAAAVLYLFARGLGTVYTSAKALSIAAPLVALVTLGGLLAASARPLRWLGAAFALAAAFCSFLILRQAPVAPGRRTPTSSPGSGRWSRVRSCSSSAATTSSSTSSGARSPTPTCATSTTPTSSSPTSSSPRWARSSTSTRSPRGPWPGSRTCSPPGRHTPAARRPATG